MRSYSDVLQRLKRDPSSTERMDSSTDLGSYAPTYGMPGDPPPPADDEEEVKPVTKIDLPEMKIDANALDALNKVGKDHGDDIVAKIGQLGNVNPDSISPKILKEVQDRLDSAKTAIDSGDEPHAALKAAAAPTKDEDSGLSSKVMLGLATILPTVIGYAFGGSRGGELGAKETGEAATHVGKYYTDVETATRKAANEKANLILKSKLEEGLLDKKITLETYRQLMLAMALADTKEKQAIVQGQINALLQIGKQDATDKERVGTETFKEGESQKEKDFKAAEAEKNRLQQIKLKQMDIKGKAGAASAKSSKEPEPKDIQWKAAGFVHRMEQAEHDFDRLEKAGYKRSDTGEGILSHAPNYVQSPQLQQQEQAEKNFLSAVLRLESGAAIADSEFTNGGKQYFTRGGDSKEVMTQKKINRAQAIASMKAEAGAAYGRTPHVTQVPGDDAARKAAAIERLKKAGRIK